MISAHKKPKGRSGAKRLGIPVVSALVFMAAMGAAGAQPRGSGFDFPPAVPRPLPYVFPAPAVRVLANGMTVLVIERHALPLVTLRLVVNTGAEADPPGAPGTAQLVTALLNQGTARRRALQIAEAIDQAGGTIDTGAEWDSSYAALSVLSDHTTQAFDLLADMVCHPAFSPAEVARKQRQTLSALEVARDDPGYVADTIVKDAVLEGTPYGHPEDGTPAAVRRLTPQALRAFHALHYRPGNAFLAVVGDVTAEEAFSLAQQFFGGWKGSAQSEKTSTTAPSPPRARLIVVDKPDAVQTEIRVGTAGIARASSDYDALTVADQILGGPATNRLFNTLRTRYGLTYGASSKLLSYRSTGWWEIKTFTRTAETAKALGVVLDEMARLHDHSISGSELGLAQGHLEGHLALQFETAEAVAKAELDLLVHGMPLDYWNHFAQKIEGLSSRQVQKATRRYLRADRSVIVLVGNARAFRQDLKPFGEARVIPITRLDLGSPGLEAPEVAEPASGTGWLQPQHSPHEKGTDCTLASH